MKGKIICILVCMLMLSSVVGALPSVTTLTKPEYTESSNTGYSHSILAEFFTYTTCEPCKYAHKALYNLYYGGWHPFYYISMVFDKNSWANARKNELNIVGSPTVVWDGGYKKDYGAGDVPSAMAKYNTSIIKCGNRGVKDIDLSLDVEWLGATNEDPEDGETGVPIEKELGWAISAMDIDVTIDNNEASQYNGHLHVYVTECNSTYWLDTWDHPYTFAFLDYAWNEDVTLSGGGSWSDSTEWDGEDHHNGGSGGWQYYDEIWQDNTMVIAAVFDEDNNDYVDETAGFLAGVDTEPKSFDIYFGNTTPPPKVFSNVSIRQYNPYDDDDLEFDTTYYWKIDVWDQQDYKNPGDIWSFTTRGNSPPYEPRSPDPINGSMTAPIDTNLSWLGGDPEGDNVTYDVYFGVFDPFNPPPKVEDNHSYTTYDPTPYGDVLDFNTKYAWKIVAWDKYGLKTTGPNWSFRTEPNYPPDPAHDPIPPDDATNVPVDAILYWNGSDPNSGDTFTYDVYFSVNPDPPLVAEDLDVAEYDPYGPNDMTLWKEYYWRIVTRDKSGLETPGPNWSFWTGLNHEPTPPDIDGPHKGQTGAEYNFTFVSTDPDNHTISYYVDWGDDTNSGWTDYYESGEMITLNHSWENRDTYNIKAKAKDFYGAESDWSDPFEHISPHNKPVIFRINLLSGLFERFARAFPMLKYLPQQEF